MAINILVLTLSISVLGLSIKLNRLQKEIKELKK